jgi:glycosyltransferase involved in cell wall biosynthesis
LAEAIKRLLKDKQLQQELGEAGRRRIQQEFSWEQAANNIVKVYQELL